MPRIEAYPSAEQLGYWAGYVLDIPKIVDQFIEAGCRNTDDYTTLDDYVCWQMSTFVDMDYILGVHFILGVRPDTTQAANHYLDDLFVLILPGRELKYEWHQEPREFFSYRGEQLKTRQLEFVHWMHAKLKENADASG